MPDSNSLNAHKEIHSPADGIQTATTLAVRMGARLKDRGKLAPKGCLCLGEMSIVEESVLRFIAVGIRKIVVVTGHLTEQFIPLKAKYRQTIHVVNNPCFADPGTLYSMYCARHDVTADFLLLKSDLVFERRALTTGPEHRSDECFVETLNGNLPATSKNRDSLDGEVAGEHFLGLSYRERLRVVQERYRRLPLLRRMEEIEVLPVERHDPRSPTRVRHHYGQQWCIGTHKSNKSQKEKACQLYTSP
jgi:choline kinase